MAQLPNEIWFQIIAYCCSSSNAPEIWGSLRHVNQRLCACVEQHFAEAVLPSLTVSLPLTLPSYDARNPIRGEAKFHFWPAQDRITGLQPQAIFQLDEIKPEYYLHHFFGRWAGVQDTDAGWLRPSVLWTLRLDEREASMRIYEACAVKEGLSENEARIEMAWKPTLTAFFRRGMIM